jgi:uncharacterized protein (TIGR03000 family)
MRTLLATVVFSCGTVFLFPGATPAQVAPVGPTANLEMKVPANASIWIDGQATTQPGTDRRFVSPPLQAGVHYSYDIRVQWTDGSRTLERSRHIRFEAGDDVRITLGGGDDPALDVLIARAAPASASASPTNALSGTNPSPTTRYESSPSLPPGLNVGNLSGPPAAGFEHN